MNVFDYAMEIERSGRKFYRNVAAKAGSLPEVLGEGPFWCDPLDVDSIADAFTRVVSDEKARSAAVEAGRKRAASYDWSTTAELTLDAYRRVAADA